MSTSKTSDGGLEPADIPRKPEKEADSQPPRELGGRKTGLDPTRYGDWEKNGRCIDF